jgi:hypothetical protein
MRSDQEITDMLRGELIKQKIEVNRLAKLLGTSYAVVSARFLNPGSVWTLDMLNRYGEILGFRAEVVFHRTAQPEYLRQPRADGFKYPEPVEFPPLDICSMEYLEDQVKAAAAGGD